MCSRVQKGLLSSARCFVYKHWRDYGTHNIHRRLVRPGGHAPANSTARPLNRRHIARTACMFNIKGFNASDDTSLQNKCEASAVTAEMEDLSWGTTMTWEGFENMQRELYPDATDPLILSLSCAESVGEIFDLICYQKLNEQQASQAIVSIWEVHKKSSKLSVRNFSDLENYLLNTQAIRHSECFRSLIATVNNSADLLTNRALVVLLLTLRRFDVPPWHPSTYNLFRLSQNRLKNFSTNCLAMWALAIRDPVTNGRLMIAPLLTVLESHMHNCQTIEDLNAISVCFLSASHMITQHMTERYIGTVERLLVKGVIDKETPILVLNKMIQALSKSYRHAPAGFALIRVLELMEQSPELDTCPSSVTVSINKSLATFMEPIKLGYRMEETAHSWLEKENLSLQHVEHLACLSQHISNELKARLEEYLARILSTEAINDLFPVYRTIFGVMRRLKISNHKLIDLFWSSVINCIARSWTEQQQPSTLFFHVIHWYMFFNNNLGGTYRLLSFEEQMLKWISEALSSRSSAAFSCRKYSQLAAFVVAYGGPTVPQVVNRILQLENQLSVRDIHILARGVECSGIISGRMRPVAVSKGLIELSLLLDRRIQYWLEKNTLLSTTSTLLLAFCHRRRRDQSDSAAIALGFQKCEEQLDQLNAGIIHHLTYCGTVNKFLSCKLMDAIFSYVIRRHKNISPPVQARVATLAMDLGYLPPALDALFPIISNTLLHAKNRLSGLTTLECALALLLHNHLASQLVGSIFTVDFLDKLDAEVAGCYSKATYPGQVRSALMELNRAVCIDMPETGVPWFHDHYCQEQLEINPPLTTTFHADVEKCLTLLLGGADYFNRFTLTPYYHLIDFQVLLDEDRKPVAQSGGNLSDQLEKVAVLIRFPYAFTYNLRNLRGLYLLQQRNLEILGYRVIGIPYHEWNSLSLSSLEAKCNYLAERLLVAKNT